MNQGEVEFEIGGAKFVLRSTLSAMKAVNRAFGGYRAALDEVDRHNMDAYVTIAAAGIDKTSNALLFPDTENKITVEQAVYEAGTINLIGPISKFVGFLSNGGRDPEQKKGAPPGN
jgi:hypothetical protein